MFLYQRLDSNWHMLCNLTTHDANKLRNSRVAQRISEQFWFYATDCANCQSAPYTVNQLHNTHCCAAWLIVNGPLKIKGPPKRRPRPDMGWGAIEEEIHIKTNGMEFWRGRVNVERWQVHENSERRMVNVSGQWTNAVTTTEGLVNEPNVLTGLKLYTRFAYFSVILSPSTVKIIKGKK
jgi:hypothetical protein